MFDPDNLLRCDFCENGTATKHIEQIKFRQLTDRGYVFCRAEVPSASATAAVQSIGIRTQRRSSTISSDKNTKSFAFLN